MKSPHPLGVDCFVLSSLMLVIFTAEAGTNGTAVVVLSAGDDNTVPFVNLHKLYT